MPSHEQLYTTNEIKLPLHEDDAKHFRAFFRKMPSAHYRQSPYWLLNSSSDNHRFFCTRDSTNGIAATSVVRNTRSPIRKSQGAIIDRGPVAVSIDVLIEHLSGVIGLIGDSCCYVRVNPFVTSTAKQDVERSLNLAGFELSSTPSTYTETLLVKVYADADQQWRSLRRSLRTSINKSKKLGVSVCHTKEPEALLTFLPRYNEFARKKEFGQVDPQLIDQLIAACNIDGSDFSVIISSAAFTGQSLGQMVFVQEKNRLTYEWGWSKKANSDDSIPIMHLIVWQVLAECRARGVNTLDLGGYWVDRGTADPINQFKRGFSRTIEEYCGEYEKVILPGWHFLLKCYRKMRKRTWYTPGN